MPDGRVVSFLPTNWISCCLSGLRAARIQRPFFSMSVHVQDRGLVEIPSPSLTVLTLVKLFRGYVQYSEQRGSLLRHSVVSESHLVVKSSERFCKCEVGLAFQPGDLEILIEDSSMSFLRFCRHSTTSRSHKYFWLHVSAFYLCLLCMDRRSSNARCASTFCRNETMAAGRVRQQPPKKAWWWFVGTQLAPCITLNRSHS
jgi:hypothetical protein